MGDKPKARILVSLRLPVGQVEQLDQWAIDFNQTRTALVIEAIAGLLNRLGQRGGGGDGMA